MMQKGKEWTDLFEKANAKVFMGGGGRAWKRSILVREKIRKCPPLRVERYAFNRALRQCRNIRKS